MPFEAIRRNMEELETINRLLGGHAITLKGIRNLAGKRKRIVVCEIGCGGADNLKIIHEWASRNGIAIDCLGIDINAACIDFARQQFPSGTYIHADYRNVVPAIMPDIVFSSLFCHHFTDEELVEQLRWMQQHSTAGFFINDLHRHPIAYHSIRLLTALFSRSPLVKHDAPLSVQRGFNRQDWCRLLQQVGINEASVHWQWAFRWLVTVQKK